MRICYLTGKELKAKISDIPQDDSESLEHIIPNALGGKLKSRDILCHKGNQDLNRLIDIPFTKIFESFCLRLDLNKDRKTSPSMRGLHADYAVDVVFKNDRYYPAKPFFDDEKKIIYADSIKTGENYKKHLLNKNRIIESDQITILDDMAGGIDLKFILDNNVFKRGFAKIAAGFASINNVSRENLKSVIDLESNTFHEKIVVAPSIPANDLERKFEFQVSKSCHYPIHGIVLSGSKQERLLYCHVELFSAFQWYVLLDDNYEGEDIHQTYAYRLVDGTDIDFSEYFNSVLTSQESNALTATYKRISRQQMIWAEKFFGQMSLREYTHSKFNSLSAFANYAFLHRKAASLGLDL